MSKLGPEAQGLVDAARDVLRPTTADRERIREALRARLGSEGAFEPEAPAPPAAAPAASGIGAAKIATAVIVGLAIGGGLLGQALRAEPAESAAPSASAPVGVTAPKAPVVPSEASPSPPAPALASPPAGVIEEPAPRRSSDHLAEEVAILSRAQAELHAGRFADALRILGEHERRFPGGTLTPERRAAKVGALCGLGRVAEADAELARLSPGSLHAERARAACGERSVR
ncbi:MAG TPA: hypothetical protein VKY73_14915 [Polyangiaceae bacterium]|nr:hypothetical protein [Polyangiaceae bacterium]